MRCSRLAIVLALAAGAVVGPAAQAADPGAIGPSLGIVNNGRHLTPYGRLTNVGNLPTGGAVTHDGRWYWTVSAGAGANDVRIVSTRTARVIQTIPLPGASGGIAIAARGRRAYVSGLKNSTNKGTTRPDLPGGEGDVVHEFTWSPTSGRARELGRLPVRPPKGAAPPQDFPVPATKPSSYPEYLAVSPDGRRLLVPLNLANAAAIVDTHTKAVRYVSTGRYPYGAAITPDGRRGLVTSETTGAVTVVDLARARTVKTIKVGGHLAHPEGIIAPPGRRAYVAVADRDAVAVLDLKRLRVERSLSVMPPAGIGASPDALAVSHDGRQLYVSEAGADTLSVFSIPSFRRLGRVPTGRYPTDVQTTGGRRPKLLWLSAKGLGVGPNPNGPNPFNSATLDQTNAVTQFLPRITFGATGIGALPSVRALKALTAQADAQLRPANLPAAAPGGTPIAPNGPIKYVFYIVRENRTYDQVLGDDPRGAGDPKLTLFGADATPNLHALATRFPLLDHIYADSEASQQGHQWTAAANINDHAERAWNQVSSPFADYGARGRPLETGFLAVSFPPRGYLFDQALRQNVSFFNYGEAYAGDIPLPYKALPILANTVDKDRTAQDAAEVQAKFQRSDFGQPIGTGCFPNALYINSDTLTGKRIFDSSLPANAPEGAESRTDCFRRHLADQLAAGDVPRFNYITLTNDHTVGLSGGQPTPQAMIADNDLGTAQIIDTISHSPIWPQSAIFVVEDDSQDGADHVDAHRIPALVVSPYAKAGAVVPTRYDQLSVIRTMELILGLHPLSLNDALATPMYDAFSATPDNIAPFDALPESQDLMAANPTTGAGARASARLDFRDLDAVPQHTLDALLWRSRHGWHSTPPAPGPNATPGRDAEG
jgi:DNA-binding beta-propeller fold protein YncE